MEVTQLLFILLFAFDGAISTALGGSNCGTNEQFYDFTLAPVCDANCQDLSRNCWLTTTRPVPGCYCRKGYARNLQQQCIPAEECATDCFPNESPLRPAGWACEYSCRPTRNSSRINICYRRGERKCICATGYCRNQRAQCEKDF